MNAVTKILNRILGKIPARGTLMTPSGEETYPIAISNEIMGGPFIVDSIDELKEIPVERLVKGCKCTVNEHEFNGVLLPTTTYLLKSIPSTTLSLVPEVNISDYWILDRPQQKEESAVEYQYAPNYKGLKPPFLGAVISKEAYNAGYGSDADYMSGDTGLIIWSSEYNDSEHIWVRQKTGTLADWGIPMKIDEGYEEGTYNDVRFMWREISLGKPASPSSMVNGKLNNEPIGWEDTPETPEGITYQDYILTHNLWRINGIKGVYGDLKSNWSDPVKVSTDPTLVRYGNDASNNDYLDDTYWRGYYTVGDRYKASRVDTSSDWVVELITGESGEYTDYVFKEFSNSYEPTLADKPQTLLGYGVNGWRDGVFVPQNGYTIYVSTSRKYSNGEMISGWTIPVRFDGKSSKRCVITADEGTLFKHRTQQGGEIIIPTSIKLKANLFDGDTKLEDSKYAVVWYLGNIDTGTRIYKNVPGSPVISGTNDSELTILPSHVDTKQVFTAVSYLEGEDYIDDITVFDVTDGIGYVPIVNSDSGYIYKGSGTKTFTGFLYENGTDISTASGIVYRWLLDGYEIGVERTVQVSDGDVTGITNLNLEITLNGVTYKVTEALTDVSDGVSIIRMFSSIELLSPSSTPDLNPSDWSTSTVNAIWAIEKYSNGNWGTAYRIKGEKGDMSGAFQKTVYRTLAPGITPTPSWVNTTPTAKTDSNSNLIPSDWSENPQTNPQTGSIIYGTKATFIKNLANTDTTELVKNWTIVGEWSAPFKVTHFPEAGSSGLPGDDGDNGWTPVFTIEPIGDKSALKVIDWIGGGGDKPEYPQYVTVTGLSPTTVNFMNVRGNAGPRGPKGDDGVFNPDDYWDGPTITIVDTKDVKFKMRKTKAGVVHYQGFMIRNSSPFTQIVPTGFGPWGGFGADPVPLNSMWIKKGVSHAQNSAGWGGPEKAFIARNSSGNMQIHIYSGPSDTMIAGSYVTRSAFNL